MAIFGRSSPAKNLTTAIQKQKALRDDLATRLEVAKATVADSNTAAKQMALAGAADAELSVADTATISAEKRVVTLSAALVEADQSLADLERQRADLDDQRNRRETCDEIQRITDDLEAAGKAFDAAIIVLIDAAKRAGLVVVDGKGLELFAGQLRDAVPPAVDLIVNAMRSHITAVMNGHAASTIGQPEPKVPAPVVKAESTKRVFSMARLCWDDDNSCAKHQDANIPVELADKAVRLGYALELSDPRVRPLRAGYAAPPLPRYCIDLRDQNLSPLRPIFGADRLKHSAGFHVTRGGHESWIGKELG